MYDDIVRQADWTKAGEWDADTVCGMARLMIPGAPDTAYAIILGTLIQHIKSSTRWISAAERRPGKDDPVQDYQVVYEYRDKHDPQRYVDITHLSEVTQNMYDWHCRAFENPQRWKRVTHWMELPKLPESNT